MWIERRDGDKRARILETIVAALRGSDVVSILDLARAAGHVSESIASRVVKRLALRGLVRNVSLGCWSGTSVLRCEPSIRVCSPA